MNRRHFLKSAALGAISVPVLGFSKDSKSCKLFIKEICFKCWHFDKNYENYLILKLPLHNGYYDWLKFSRTYSRVDINWSKWKLQCFQNMYCSIPKFFQVNNEYYIDLGDNINKVPFERCYYRSFDKIEVKFTKAG